MRTHLLVFVATAGLMAGPAYAQRPSHAGPKTPKVTTPSVKPVSAGPKAPRTTGPKAPKTTGPKTPKAGGPKMAGGPKTTGKATGAAKGGTHVPPGQAKRAAGTTTATPLADGTTVPPAMPKNEKLAARLQALLPAGMTLEQAAEGFRNQGQLVAAIRVSNNLGIPFEDLKTSMVTDGLSLGQSIQQLRPTADADTEAARATQWASQQLDDAPQTDPQ